MSFQVVLLEERFFFNLFGFSLPPLYSLPYLNNNVAVQLVSFCSM